MKSIEENIGDTVWAVYLRDADLDTHSTHVERKAEASTDKTDSIKLKYFMVKQTKKATSQMEKCICISYM